MTLPAAQNETLALQLTDIAGNKSDFVAVVMTGLPVANITIATTNLPRGNSDIVTITVTNGAGEAVDGLFVNLFEDADFMDGQGAIPVPLTDINFWETGFDGAGSGAVTIDVPEYLPGSEVFTSETFITGGIAHIFTKTGATIGVVNLTGLDRVGPTIGLSIFPDVDFQLTERGKGEADILNILNILPAASGVPTSVPADAVSFVVILADGNADGEIDVNDAGVVRVAMMPLNALISQEYGFDIPGVDNINLGENYWNASTQSVVGHEELFVALFDRYSNYAVDPIPIVLDVRVTDPDTNLISVSSSNVSGSAGAVDDEAIVSLYANPGLTDFLGSAAADETGAFSVDYARDAVDELYIVAADTAGNKSNGINLTAITGGNVIFVIADGYGLLHTNDSTISAAPRATDLVEAISPIPGDNGPFYILDALGSMSPYWIVKPTNASLPKATGLGLTADLARDLEVTSVDGSVSGYVLLGQGLVIPIGDAPFFGDIAGTNLNRIEQPTGKYLIDENGNGVYDTEDTNGNGKLDVLVVYDSQGNGSLVTEDANGNGILDQELIIDPNDASLGFDYYDAARDLEVVYNADGEPTGYILIDNFGVLHSFGDVGPELQNSRVDFGFTYQALELVTGASNNVLDFVALSGSGSVVGFPGGYLGAPPAVDTQGNERGDAGLLTDPLEIDLPYFGFDIMRDIEVNPVDTNRDGVTNDGLDGFYVLDGFGGIHAIGGAPAVSNAPFLGFDIAKDLEFVRK